MFLLLMLLSSICNAQFSLQPRVGFNENRHFVFALDVAYRIRGIELAGIINDVQKVSEPAFMGFRLGYAVPVAGVEIMPMYGRSFMYVTNDKPSENIWVNDFGLRVATHLPGMIEKSQIFLQVNYLTQTQVTLGLKF